MARWCSPLQPSFRWTAKSRGPSLVSLCPARQPGGSLHRRYGLHRWAIAFLRTLYSFARMLQAHGAKCKIATRRVQLIRRTDGASPVGCIFSKRIPREVQAQQTETDQNAQWRIPTLYVPLRILALRILGCWEPPWRVSVVAICCTLFTNCCTGPLEAKRVADCSQTVSGDPLS